MMHSRMFNSRTNVFNSRTNVGFPLLRAGKARLGRMALDFLGRFAMSGRQHLALAALACCAAGIGLTATGAMQARTAELEARLEEARRTYVALDNEHILLLTTRAQLGSRERIGKIAGARLQLFEPEAGQVQHM